MPEWNWIAPLVVGALALVAIYLWARRRSTVDPDDRRTVRPAARAHTPEPPPSSARAAEAPLRGAILATSTAAPAAHVQPLPKLDALPRLEDDEDEEEDLNPTKVGTSPALKAQSVSPPAKRIVYDDDADQEDPTYPRALILLSASAKTDRGLRRKRNEDSLLVKDDQNLFAVADGMGGYHGGDVASSIAVETIERAFVEQRFEGEPHSTIPWRASELARAIQMANEAILSRAQAHREYVGMGTTICAARFSPNKQRMYIGHVGDSRMYRMRGGKLSQMTHDHTMKDFGVTDATSGQLSRAVGIWPTVPVDVIIGKPKPGDVYLICSDGLTKMMTDEAIAQALGERRTPSEVVQTLIEGANAKGGRDNITVILIKVEDAPN